MHQQDNEQLGTRSKVVLWPLHGYTCTHTHITHSSEGMHVCAWTQREPVGVFLLYFSFLKSVASFSLTGEQFNFRICPNHLYKGKCSQGTWHTPLWPWRQQSPGRESHCAWRRVRISLSQAQGRSAGSPLGGSLHIVPGPAWQPGMTQSVLAYGNQAQGSQRRAV